MSKVIYSFVVEFDKKDAPTLSVKTNILGGRMVGVSFTDLIEENQRLEERIEELESN